MSDTLAWLQRRSHRKSRKKTLMSQKPPVLSSLASISKDVTQFTHFAFVLSVQKCSRVSSFHKTEHVCEVGYETVRCQARSSSFAATLAYQPCFKPRYGDACSAYRGTGLMARCQMLLDGLQELIFINGLAQVATASAGQAFVAVFRHGVRRERNDRCRQSLAAQLDRGGIAV